MLRTIGRQKLSNDLEQKPLKNCYQPLTMLVPELQGDLPTQRIAASPFPQQEPLRLWEALLAVLMSTSRRAPLLVVLDDLQWVDGSSCNLLSYLCRHLVDRPVLVVGTCRESDLPAKHPLRAQLVQLERERLVESLSLSALTDDQIAALIEHLPASWIRTIQLQAAGNPLFAEELACQCDQKEQEKKASMSLAEKASRTALPSTIATLLDQRLSVLSSACQQFLRFAAVLGRSFSLGTIHKLLTHRTTDLDEGQVLMLIYEQQNLPQGIATACCELGRIHMMKAEYGLAQSFTRRSLSITEQIGDHLFTSLAFAHLGLLAVRLGNLSEAEQWFLEGLKLEERINDLAYRSFFHSYLANVLYLKGKITEARENVYRALQISRSARIAYCVGQALVSLGEFRIIQACFTYQGKEQTLLCDKERVRLLRRAKKTLEHALAIDGMEGETRIEGRIALAQVTLFFGNEEQALHMATNAQDEAQRCELAWLTPRIQRLLGNILSAQGVSERAHKHFEQALQAAQEYQMPLESARAMLDYGKALLAEGRRRDKGDQQGLQYLHEARQLFSRCSAMLELQSVEQFLAYYEEQRTHEIFT